MGEKNIMRCIISCVIIKSNINESNTCNKIIVMILIESINFKCYGSGIHLYTQCSG